MRHDYLKTSKLGMVAVLSVLSSAAAQAAGPTPPPAGPAEVAAIVKPGAAVTGPHTGGVRVKGGVKGAASAPFVLGWNYEVGQASWVQTANNINFYLFCYNTDGSIFFAAVNSPLLMSFQNQLLEGCKRPGGYHVHVINSSTGEFDIIFLNEP